jgi:hypothetical protein
MICRKLKRTRGPEDESSSVKRPPIKITISLKDNSIIPQTKQYEARERAPVIVRGCSGGEDFGNSEGVEVTRGSGGGSGNLDFSESEGVEVTGGSGGGSGNLDFGESEGVEVTGGSGGGGGNLDCGESEGVEVTGVNGGGGTRKEDHSLDEDFRRECREDGSRSEGSAGRGESISFKGSRGGVEFVEDDIPTGEEEPRYDEQRRTRCDDGGSGGSRGGESAQLLVPRKK